MSLDSASFHDKLGRRSKTKSNSTCTQLLCTLTLQNMENYYKFVCQYKHSNGENVHNKWCYNSISI